MEYGNSKRPINSCDGAIFPCNKFIKKECFRRKLFGLQSNYSDFVKLIKTGTILFLFEPEERKLNGIFRAISDGAMNIVPSAFSSLQKRFLAQVRFEILCACSPLSEKEFRGSIEENYFTPTKFNLALSRQQVCNLILLFSSRSGFSYNQFPGRILSEFMKTDKSSNLARTRAIGNEKLLKLETAGYNMDNNNIHSTGNPISSVCSEDDLMSYHNHDLHYMRFQNHVVQRQHEPYPTVSRTLDSRQPDQMLSKSCYDIPMSSVCREGHLTSYRNHELHDITFQDRMVRQQHEPCPSISHTLESRRPDQLLSKSCYDLLIPSICSENNLESYHNFGLDDITLLNHAATSQHESYPAVCTAFEPRQTNEIASERCYSLYTEPIPYSSSLRPLHEQPSPFLGMERPYLCKKAHDLCTESFLDFEASHIRTKSFTSTPHLGARNFTLTNYPGNDISKFSPISEHSKPSPPSPEGHVNFHHFNRTPSPVGSHPLPGRLRAITSPSLQLKNTWSYSRSTQQEGSSSSIQDCPSSLVNYIPVSEGNMLIDSSYNLVVKDEVVNEEDAFKLFPLMNKFQYHSGFTTDTNFLVTNNFDFIYNDKSSASDLKMFSQSDVVQKRASVFSRLSRSTKDFRCLRKKLLTKMNRKPEYLETLETDAQQLDNTSENELFENDFCAEIAVEESKESNGVVFRNFKRRSIVKQESNGASDLGLCKKRKIIRPSFTEGDDDLGLCKKRKIIRPSFTEGDDSSQVKNSRRNHLYQPGEGSGSVVNGGLPISSLQQDKDSETTDSSVIDIRRRQWTLNCQSEIDEKFPVELVAHEPSDNYIDVILGDDVEAKQENSCDLPLLSSVLPEEKHTVIHASENSCSFVRQDNAIGKEEHLHYLPSYSSALFEDKHKVLHESDKSYSLGLDGKEENSCDLPLHSSAPLQETHKVIHESENNYRIVIRDNVCQNSEENSHNLPSHCSTLLKEKHKGNHEYKNSYNAVFHDDSVDGKEENLRNMPFHSSASLKEMHEVIHESENDNIIIRDNILNGKSEEHPHDLPSHSSAPLEEKHETSNNSTAVFYTSSVFVSNGFPEKDSITNTDMNCITIVNMDSLGFPPSVRCQTEILDFPETCNKIVPNMFAETGSNYQR